MTIVLTRNLPGLLEVIILSRLNLDRGISYAITTLLSYIIIAIGVSLSLGLLGVSWSKLQWLVAALSVGLGFGLQEIFANFVSGQENNTAINYFIELVSKPDSNLLLARYYKKLDSEDFQDCYFIFKDNKIEQIRNDLQCPVNK